MSRALVKRRRIFPEGWHSSYVGHVFGQIVDKNHGVFEPSISFNFLEIARKGLPEQDIMYILMVSL